MKARITLIDVGKSIVDEYVEAGKTAEWEKTIEVRVPKDETTFMLVQRKLRLVVKMGPAPVAPPPQILEPPAQTIQVSVPHMDQLIQSLHKNHDWSAEFNRHFGEMSGALSNIATNIGAYFTAQTKVVEELTAELHWERIRNQQLEVEINRLRNINKITPVRSVQRRIVLPNGET